MSEQIPIIDLFAGPGGLGEGFSRFPMNSSKKKFKIKLSIEKDPYAHKTLTTRAFFRQFEEGKAPDAYYEYLRGELTKDELFAMYPVQGETAKAEAQQRTLGDDPAILSLIGKALDGAKDWLLIGGPPCQAYSLVGRSRMLGLTQGEGESEDEFKNRKQLLHEEFQGDHRHTLYQEYLKIIAEHEPSVFVMENVKGILSAKLNGELIFPKILDDLKQPQRAYGNKNNTAKYRVLSFVTKTDSEDGSDLEPTDYLIKAENYGIPQARHRVILLGVREDITPDRVKTLIPQSVVPVDEVLTLPTRTSGLSKGEETPYKSLGQLFEQDWWRQFEANHTFKSVANRMRQEFAKALKRENRGFETQEAVSLNSEWYRDNKLGIVLNHQTRSHIKEDLWRYFFCACYAIENNGISPKLKDFPTELLPKHKNVNEAIAGKKFADRFRVQCWGKPATTITSHISKDGHYFIHPNPRQYRSLTVREAARIQTFPDNYLFEGPRTQQFHQVGNAVPPKLAYRISEVVAELFPST